MAKQWENQFEIMDLWAMFTGFLGVINYELNLQQTTNDELMEEMKHQNTEYLVEMNKKLDKIIELLGAE